MSFTPLELLVIALAGGGVGFVAGVFGVGGGFLLVPVLNARLGVPMNVAVGAAACQALGPATTALLYRRVERSDLRFPLVMSGGLVVGVLAGAATLEWAQGVVDVPGERPFVERVVLGVYLVLLTGLGLFAVWETARTAHGNPVRRGWLQGVMVPPSGRFKPELELGRMSIPVLSWFGLGVGYLSGLLGISGGLVLLPGVVYLFGVPAQQAVRCSLVVVWLVSAQSTVVHAWHGNIPNLWLVAALLCGGTLGARFGSVVGSRIGGTRLRRRFGWLLLATAGMIAYDVMVGSG